jgi:hypothetical protein
MVQNRQDLFQIHHLDVCFGVVILQRYCHPPSDVLNLKFRRKSECLHVFVAAQIQDNDF